MIEKLSVDGEIYERDVAYKVNEIIDVLNTNADILEEKEKARDTLALKVALHFIKDKYPSDSMYFITSGRSHGFISYGEVSDRLERMIKERDNE